MEYRTTVHINGDVAKLINKCLGMNAAKLYEKYGIKRYETLYSTTGRFDNGNQVDVNVNSCSEDAPYVDVVLFDRNGNELACEVDEDDVIEGSKRVCYGDDEYWVDITVKEDDGV